MEKKKNVLSRALIKIIKRWEELGNVDIERASDVKLTPDQKKELLEVEAVGEEVHKENIGFVQTAKVDEAKASEKAHKKAIQKGQKVLGDI